MHRLLPIAITAIALTPTLAFGLGSDHKPGDLPVHDAWPAGVYDAVNQANRVHGYWVNSFDALFYRGSQPDLHKMIRELAAVPDLNVTVVLHVGAGVAKSPWSKKPVGSADWRVTIRGAEAISRRQDQVTVDIWLAGKLTLADLVIPPSVTVRSGGEIEKFIQEHTAEPKREQRREPETSSRGRGEKRAAQGAVERALKVK